MLLAVNVGNTNIVFGIHDGARWAHLLRVHTVKEKMPDEYGLLFRNFLREVGLETARFAPVVMSSVVPALTWKLEAMLERYTAQKPLVISHQVECGLTFRVKNPAEVGADLICDAVAAYHYTDGACLAVDCGTATSFVAVSAQAEFLGVAIAPGANLMSAALALNTAQLPQIALTQPASAIGTDTVSALSAGIVLGYVGMVERIIDCMAAEMAAPVTVVATGGLGRFIQPLTERLAVYNEWLTLDGMRLIALRNQF